LKEIVEQTAPGGLCSLEIGSVPNGGAAAFSVPGTGWLTFDWTVNEDGDAAYVEPWWRSAIATAAFRSAAEDRGMTLVRGYSVRSRSPSGEIIREDGVGISAVDFRIPAGPKDADELRTRLSQTTSKSLRFVSLEVAQPEGAAPIITLETSDPRAFFHENADDLGQFVDALQPYEAYLIRVVDSGAHLVWIQGFARRAGAVTSWARPGLQGETG
jgi:hypothetical protein